MQSGAPSPYTDLVNQLSQHRLPAGIVDLSAFDRNLRCLAEITTQSSTDGTRRKTIRLATKSLRVPALIRRALDSHPSFQGLLCYSAEEVLFLAEQGFDDFLLAYPSFQKSDIAAILQTHQMGKQVRAIVDSVDGVLLWEQALATHPQLERKLKLVVDIDASTQLLGMHLGVRRSPLRTIPAALEVVQAIHGSRHLQWAGLMMYEAQVASLGDRNPFQKLLNPLTHWIRRDSAQKVTRFRQALLEALQAHGFTPPLFNGGGSGSFNWSAQDPTLTEVTAGSGFLGPALFDYFSNIRFEPALYFALSVTRRSDAKHITCLGGGYVSSGAPGWDKVPQPLFPSYLRLLKHEACGEVQTPLRADTPHALNDVILFRPAKSGELAERFTTYQLWDSEKQALTETAQTYRGYGKCFL